MERIGIRELKQQASAVIRRVTAGESIEITDYGHPVARLVPLRGGMLEQLVAGGRSTEPRADLFDLMDDAGVPMALEAGATPGPAALDEEREDER